MWPCSPKCTVYACDYANERTVTWLSFMAICRSACNRSRSCRRRSLWDVSVMNLSSPPTDMFSVSWREQWQLVASPRESCGNFHSGSFQETRSGQPVNTQTLLSTWKPSDFIMVCSTWGNNLILSCTMKNFSILSLYITSHLHNSYTHIAMTYHQREGAHMNKKNFSSSIILG